MILKSSPKLLKTGLGNGKEDNISETCLKSYHCPLQFIFHVSHIHSNPVSSSVKLVYNICVVASLQYNKLSEITLNSGKFLKTHKKSADLTFIVETVCIQ